MLRIFFKQRLEDGDCLLERALFREERAVQEHRVRIVRVAREAPLRLLSRPQLVEVDEGVPPCRQSREQGIERPQGLPHDASHSWRIPIRNVCVTQVERDREANSRSVEHRVELERNVERADGLLELSGP